MIHFAEIRTDYRDENNYQYVDTWLTEDDTEEGHCVAGVNLNTNEVVWIDKTEKIISNPQIILAIADIIRNNKNCK